MSIALATAVVPAKSSLALMARIRGAGGSLITQASLTGLSYWVRDLTAGTDVTTSSQSLTISSCVFDSLVQNNVRWSQDSAAFLGVDGSYGYNFLAVVPGTLFTAYDQVQNLGINKTLSHSFQIDVRFAGVDGSIFTQPFKVSARAVFGPA